MKTDRTFATENLSLSGAPDRHPARRLYLLVFVGETSSMCQLPATGDVLIGRSESAELRLDDGKVSRRHAEIRLEGGEARLRDLGSNNGTFVNGEAVEVARGLLSGDVITIGNASLVFHSDARQSPARNLVDMDGLRDQMEGEIERAVSYDRPFALLALGADVEPQDQPYVGHVLARVLRRIDRMAWSTRGQAFLLLPETAPDSVESVALRAIEALESIHIEARVGAAACPRDGCDMDTLMAAARSALAAAEPGAMASAEVAFRRIAIGDQTAIVADEAMTRLYALLERLAAADLPVLVYGETGTGKELAASAVHAFSHRAKHPMLTLNCAALQETLVESALFGHVAGAFTGASHDKQGLLEAANGGTVFLDEIGEMSPSSQAKLLRVLETRRFTRVGDVKEREVDIRIVAATNRDLKQEAAAGRFREDLYFRLSAATVWLPPLRDRRREIPILAHRFATDACERAGRAPLSITEDAIKRLASYRWPGNIRELRNTMERAVLLSGGDPIGAEHLTLQESLATAGVAQAMASSVAADAPAPADLTAEQQAERQRIIDALASARGNQTKAAQDLGISLRWLSTKMARYKIPRARD